LSDKPIGLAEVELSKLADHTVHDIWLPVAGPKCHSDSAVHVLARYTPLNIAGLKVKSSRLPSFRMQLERRTFFPGEMIRGQIIYNVGQPKKIRGIRVKFQGYEKVSWTETRHITRPDGSSGTETVWFTANHTFCTPYFLCSFFSQNRPDFFLYSQPYRYDVRKPARREQGL
jgi:hypothetical protein